MTQVYINTLLFIFVTTVVYHRILNTVPCASILYIQLFPGAHPILPLQPVSPLPLATTSLFLFKENPLLKTGSVAMWTFLGKHISRATFCFLLLSEGLSFLVSFFWFSASVILFFGNSPQCGQNRIHCTEMPVTVLTGTRLSPRQTGNIRSETTFGFAVYTPAAAKTAQVLHLLPFGPCLYKRLFWDFISESLRLGNRKNLAWIGLGVFSRECNSCNLLDK